MRGRQSEASAGGLARRRAAFLDRDGTLIVERHYLSDPDGVELIAGVAPALRALRESGHALIVVTNQSGIARGLISPAEYEAVQNRLAELLGEEGVVLDGVYHCPHHPDITGPCVCRKPGAALFEQAAREHHLDLSASLYIGDRVRDVLPALRYGGRGFLVLTGHGKSEAGHVPAGIKVVGDLAAGVDHYLGMEWGAGPRDCGGCDRTRDRAEG